MPFFTFYLPDAEEVKRYLCAWMLQVWKRATARLFQDDDLNPVKKPSGFFRTKYCLFLVLAYGLFAVDWAGHLRSAAVLAFAHFWYKERRPLMTSFRDYSVCWFNDVQFGTIMTTGRLARECEFARYRLLMATGLSETASRLGIGLSVGSVHVVFQHPLRLFTPFVIDTAVVAFDSRAIYVEQRVARLSDEVIVAVVTAAQVVNCEASTIFDILRNLDTPGCRLPSPLPPPATKACAQVAAETRDMLRRDMEQCRQGKKFWEQRGGAGDAGDAAGHTPTGVATATAPTFEASRRLCLQERLKLSSQ